jgi:hypothetical protein
MDTYYAAAASLAFIVGLIHSVFGEIMIFRRVTELPLRSAAGAPILGRAHLRILRVTWHVTTFLGWGLGAMLLHLSTKAQAGETADLIVHATMAAFLASSILTLVGTRGRHPGWIALLGIVVILALR